MAPLEMLSVAVCEGADLHEHNQTDLATPDRIPEQTTEMESGPAAAAPTDRNYPDWPCLRVWPLPKCLLAPHTFLYPHSHLCRADSRAAKAKSKFVFKM